MGLPVPCKRASNLTIPVVDTPRDVTRNTSLHGRQNDACSAQLEISRDIRKTYDLIKFVGCKTHHDLSVGLRMLSPFLSSPAADASPSTSNRMLPIYTDDDISIRHVPPEPRLSEEIVISVIEMYVKAKLASRPRATRNTERGRFEVGRKLQILEKEVRKSFPSAF